MSWNGALLGVALACTMPSNYLYPVREGKQFGFIDRNGKVVIAPKYDAVGEFSEDRVRVHVGSKAGYIDSTGRMIIEPKYENAEDFEQGRAVVRDEQGYLIIDRSGKVINRIPHRVMGSYHGGLLKVQRARSEGKPTAYGFVDRDGKIVIEPQFTGATDIPDDPADLAVGSLNREWCYFDRTGKIVIRVPMGEHLDPSRPFRNGRMLAKEGFNYGYKDATGNWAIPPKFNAANDFQGGFASVQDGAKWISIDTSGLEVKRKPGPQPVGEPVDGLTKVMQNGLVGWVDSRGELLIPLRQYDQTFDFSCGLVRIKLDGRFGYMDQKGKLVIPNQFDTASDFNQGLASVFVDGGFGYINTSGTVVWKAAPLPKLKLQ